MNVLKSKKEQITLYYGNQTLNGAPYNHTGIDIVKNYNQLDSIIAARKGKVVAVRKDVVGYLKGSYGNYVKLQHNDGYETLYAHMKYGTVNVNVGDIVEEGQEIGYMGATGYVTGAHLHFEVRKNGACIDPLPYLQDNANIPGYNVEPVKPVEVPSDWVDYTIKSGDTLNAIAEARGTTAQEIQKYNPIIKDINFIVAGWVIKVPPVKEQPQPQPQPVAELQVGDDVIVNGIGYGASDGTGGQTLPRTEQPMKLVRINKGAKFPYACNQNRNMNGVTAWWSDVRKM